MNGYNVGDRVIWTSRFTGNETQSTFRGDFNGQAMLWTGTLQVAVPYEDIRRGAYGIKCDDCREEIGRTDSVRVSAEGGVCGACERDRRVPANEWKR